MQNNTNLSSDPEKSSTSDNESSEYDTSDDDVSDVSVSSDEVEGHSNNIDLYGKLLNKYNIINEIGRGADAIVWLAFSMEDNKYYAIKVNEAKEYKRGLEEFKFLKKLNPNLYYFNHLKDSFVEMKQGKKYTCGVFELHTGNLDTLIRKGEYPNGLSIPIIKKILYQLLLALKHLHINMRVYHADIKTDNILLKGQNEYDNYIINQYNSFNFNKKYQELKKEYWLGKGKSIESIKNIKNEEKYKIRKILHEDIISKINFSENKELKYVINDKYVNDSKITLSDFGAWCSYDEHYDEQFGTRYYRAPEVLLIGKTTTAVDIWATGCVFYELLTGELLFNPDKDSYCSRDDNHLYLINSFCQDFSLDFLKKTKKWKSYFDSYGNLHKFEKINKISFEKLLTKYNMGDDKDNIINLLNGMLTIIPQKRFTVDQCLNHPFFNS
jgi:serine/threonine-protein kinase SRPK3